MVINKDHSEKEKYVPEANFLGIFLYSLRSLREGFRLTIGFNKYKEHFPGKFLFLKLSAFGLRGNRDGFMGKI